MRKVLVGLCLFLHSGAFAKEVSTGLSLMAGLSAINSEAGYTVGIISPYFNNNSTAGMFQFSQLAVGTSGSYDMFNFGILSRLFSIDRFSSYFKTNAFILPSQERVPSSNVGLNFALGGEYLDKTFAVLTFFSELGWNFPLIHETQIARGVQMNLGVKYYF